MTFSFHIPARDIGPCLSCFKLPVMYHSDGPFLYRRERPSSYTYFGRPHMM